mmetsp:Transcript_34974/g.65271  ORF Transcript_34974/g.65271 Transcript_34974/m.65271 type:complete len:219 (-) Transcript_34974:331-987(-)
MFARLYYILLIYLILQKDQLVSCQLMWIWRLFHLSSLTVIMMMFQYPVIRLLQVMVMTVKVLTWNIRVWRERVHQCQQKRSWRWQPSYQLRIPLCTLKEVMTTRMSGQLSFPDLLEDQVEVAYSQLTMHHSEERPAAIVDKMEAEVVMVWLWKHCQAKKVLGNWREKNGCSLPESECHSEETPLTLLCHQIENSKEENWPRKALRLLPLNEKLSMSNI